MCAHAPLLLADAVLADDVARLAGCLMARGLTLATAESCTGGLIAATFTSMPGSSGWFVGGVVAYANSVKQGVLGVDAATLARHGAVSEAVVRAMALGACRALRADVAVSVSGVAGPGGGTLEKPVGLVWLGFARVDATGTATVDARCCHFSGAREAVRAQSVCEAVRGLLRLMAPAAPLGAAGGLRRNPM